MKKIIPIGCLLLTAAMIFSAQQNDFRKLIGPGPLAATIAAWQKTATPVAASPLPPALRMTFVSISPGSFLMGSENGDADERPVHRVRITRAFELQRTEVTQGQWEAVMGSNPSLSPFKEPNCPLDNVSWEDTRTFIVKLNEMKDGYTYRLPTEAEWEYAARAGTTGDFGGTGNPDEMGWLASNAGRRAHPVAKKQPNAWGLYDMHGNVWEWVEDWYGPYSEDTLSAPRGAIEGDRRVRRGGGFYFEARDARSANRSGLIPSRRDAHIGFRLARDPNPASGQEMPLSWFPSVRSKGVAAVLPKANEIVGVNRVSCPIVTHDGKYLFFISDLDGKAVPYWVDAGFIEELRKKELQEN